MDDLNAFLQNWLDREFVLPFEWILPSLIALLLFELIWWFWLPAVLSEFIDRGVFVRTSKFLLGVWLLRLFVCAGYSVWGLVSGEFFNE